LIHASIRSPKRPSTHPSMRESKDKGRQRERGARKERRKKRTNGRTQNGICASSHPVVVRSFFLFLFLFFPFLHTVLMPFRRLAVVPPHSHPPISTLRQPLAAYSLCLPVGVFEFLAALAEGTLLRLTHTQKTNRPTDHLTAHAETRRAHEERPPVSLLQKSTSLSSPLFLSSSNTETDRTGQACRRIHHKFSSLLPPSQDMHSLSEKDRQKVRQTD